MPQIKSSHAHLKSVYAKSDKNKAVVDLIGEAATRAKAKKPCTKEWHALLKAQPNIETCPHCKKKI